MRSIDLNCDMGESFGSYRLGEDERLLDVVTSANIACGFHAGDAATMRRTTVRCLEKGVAIGAHPGLPDLQGFGRRKMAITADEAYEITVYQVGALYGFVKAAGASLHHVKPHGALYNMAAANREIARALARAVHDIDESLIFYGLSASAMIQEAEAAGLRTANEVFADRTYQRDGSLTSREQQNAVIQNERQALEQILSIVKQGKVRTADGGMIEIQAQTVCLHGDHPQALAYAYALKNGMLDEGVEIKGI